MSWFHKEIREMLGPKGRQAFVMMGARMFGAVLEVVDEALKGNGS